MPKKALTPTTAARSSRIEPRSTWKAKSFMRARHVLIAAGAEPIPLSIPSVEHLVTNEEFLFLERLPRRIVLVGGGYIAAEFSNIAA